MALNINEQARKEANLRLLQRSMDRSITDILGSATHVVLYHFHSSTQSWEKSNVEGSLFLATRGNGNGGSYLLVILNRNSPDNYPIELSKDFQLQHSDPYLIFRQQINGEMTVRGIWFPNPDERITMYDLLTEVSKSLKQQQQQTQKPPTPPSAQVPATAATTTATDHASATAALLSTLSLDVGRGNVGEAATGGGGSSLLLSSLSSSSKSQQQQKTSTTPVRQSSPSQNTNQPLLDKKSLQLALLSLIQDDRFLDLLHAQYLKVAHARAHRSGNNNNDN